MTTAALEAALVEAGYQTTVVDDYVTFPYVVPVGGLAGEQVTVGLSAPDFPVIPPGGVHLRPRIHHPGDKAHHASPLGPDWIYWSRPAAHWANTTRTIDDYLAHLRKLFTQFEN